VEQPRQGIESLEGEELNGVAFVMDYVEFHFNGPVLRALTNPVFQGTQRVEFPDAGSRDALCSLIGSTVESVEVREEDAIRLTFTDGRMLIVPLDEESRVGPEAATFQTGRKNSPLDVW
jgi:hypothetical protein